MILVDTSIWVAHFKGMPDASRLPDLLLEEDILTHPHVIGELVLGGLAAEPRALLQKLPAAQLARDEEVLIMVDQHDLAGRGIGWVDAHLLASARLGGAAIWTRDASLAAVADALGLSPSRD